MHIVHASSDGGLVVLTPGIGVELRAAAEKDVPAGVPFVLVDEAEIPTTEEDWTAFKARFDDPDGYGGT